MLPVLQNGPIFRIMPHLLEICPSWLVLVQPPTPYLFPIKFTEKLISKSSANFAKIHSHWYPASVSVSRPVHHMTWWFQRSGNSFVSQQQTEKDQISHRYRQISGFSGHAKMKEPHECVQKSLLFNRWRKTIDDKTRLCPLKLSQNGCKCLSSMWNDGLSSYFENQTALLTLTLLDYRKHSLSCIHWYHLMVQAHKTTKHRCRVPASIF